MSKPYQQPGPFSEKEMHIACDLIKNDTDRQLTAEAFMGGVAQSAYGQLASLDPGELKHADQIWLAVYGLGSSKKSAGDAEIMTEHLAKLDGRGFN